MSAPSHQLRESELPRTSAGRFLDQLADLFFDGGSESVHCKRGSPKVTVIEGCVLLETEGRVPRLELCPALEEADDLAVLRISGHAVPSFRTESRRLGFDNSVDPLRHDAIRFRHVGDLRQC